MGLFRKSFKESLLELHDKADLPVDAAKVGESIRQRDLVLHGSWDGSGAGLLTEHVRLNLQFLGKVRGKLSVEKVVDMVENARRRILDQARYDDGVARLYRSVEMWHSGGSSSAGPSKRRTWDGGRFRRKHAKNSSWRLDESSRQEEFLDLTRARMLDRILSGDLAEDENILRDLLRQRNDSILAHGLNPISEGSAKKFLEYVDTMVDKPQIRAQAAHPRLESL